MTLRFASSFADDMRNDHAMIRQMSAAGTLLDTRERRTQLW